MNKNNLYKKHVFLLATCLLTGTVCKKKKTIDIDPRLLVGEWDCAKFANKMKNGTIVDISVISAGHLIIPNWKDWHQWIFVYVNDIYFHHFLSEGNLIKLIMCGSTYARVPPEEGDICEALRSTYSFDIKGNELMIYFTETENKIY